MIDRDERESDSIPDGFIALCIVAIALLWVGWA